MKNLTNLLFILLFSLNSFSAEIKTNQNINQKKFNQDQLYCINYQGLLQVKEAVEKNDPAIQTSYNKLIQQAQKAIKAGPFSVTYEGKVPPSGDVHDYFSIPPYAGTGDGLTNPKWYVDYDRVPLEKLTQTLETLALAYFFTNDKKYAQRAAYLIRVWFVDTKTRMNPDLEFAQANTKTGVIDTRFLPRIIDSIGLLQTSGAWTKTDQKVMKEWCTKYIANVQRRTDDGHKASGHNISSWYHVQMASLALYSGNKKLASELLERTKARLDTALTIEGAFKKETGRTRSMSYSCFHAFAMFNLASMGEKVGIDLWNYKTLDGRGFELALHYLAKYSGPENKKHWPYKEIKGAKGDWWEPYYDMLPVVLYHASKVYGNEFFDTVSKQITGNKLDESRIQVMCGIPIKWFDTITHK